MFKTLSGRLSGVFDGLAKRAVLSEADVTEAMREVRLAMLDADVAYLLLRILLTKYGKQP